MVKRLHLNRGDFSFIQKKVCYNVSNTDFYTKRNDCYEHHHLRHRQKCNVSIATVSRVLNGSTRVSEKTRAKVLQVMKEMGYKPNPFARGLASIP